MTLAKRVDAAQRGKPIKGINKDVTLSQRDASRFDCDHAFTRLVLMPHAHLHSPTYAPPVIRAASPASSLGTVYPPDTTSPSDDETEISQAAFENKWHEKLRLGREFVREWQGDSSGTAEEGTWTVKDREKAGWGVEPLIAKDMGPRTPAEDQRGSASSLQCIDIYKHFRHS